MVTSPKIIFIVVGSLALTVFLGLGGIYHLILLKTDAALIAIISGPVLTALGALISLLNNTRTQAAPAANPPNGGSPTPVTIENKSNDPVPVTETKP